MKKFRDYRLLCDCRSVSLPEDERESTVQRYALYQDARGNFIVLSAGCAAKDESENVPEIDALIDDFADEEIFGWIPDHLEENEEVVVCAEKWYGKQSRCLSVEGGNFYESIIDKDYFRIISDILTETEISRLKLNEGERKDK